MRVENETVIFEHQDMHFVKKVGIQAATEMVLDYRSCNNTPFLYDICQLVDLLCTSPAALRALLDDIPSHYRLLKIPKKSGGVRELHEPDEELRRIQKIILHQILYLLPSSPFATAYHPGDTLYFNAMMHVGKRYLMKVDITDFFGSIRFDLVYKSVFNTSRFPKEIGAMLTSLCCLEDVLPQGTCTSPALSNLVMSRFDAYFGEWCRGHFLTYTRYCDDITVSGDFTLYPAYLKVKEVLGEMGFTLNEKKTRFTSSGSRQTVTGLTVNEKISIPSDYKRKLRQELYYVMKYGPEDVIDRMELAEYQGENGARRYCESLMGRLNYVISIEPGSLYFLRAKEKLRGMIA